MIVSELALMQLILGVFGFEYLANRADVQVNGNIQTLKRVFPKKSGLFLDISRNFQKFGAITAPNFYLSE
jgi:hypothetical protein